MRGVGIAGCGHRGEPIPAAPGLMRNGLICVPPLKFPGLTVTNDACAFDLKTLIAVVRDADRADEVLFGTHGFSHIADLETAVISGRFDPV